MKCDVCFSLRLDSYKFNWRSAEVPYRDSGTPSVKRSDAGVLDKSLRFSIFTCLMERNGTFHWINWPIWIFSRVRSILSRGVHRNYKDKSRQSTCWPWPSDSVWKNDASTAVLLGKRTRPVQRRTLSNRELHWLPDEMTRAIGIEDFADHSMITRRYSGRKSRYDSGWSS